MAETNYFRVTSVLFFYALILNTKFGLGVCFMSRQTAENNDYQYSIDKPTFQWDGFRLNIDYRFSSSIEDEIIKYAIVSDKDCEGGIISDAEIESSLIEVSDKSVRLSLLLNPENIHGARYTTHYENFALVGVCARLWINRAPSSLEDEVETVSAPRDDYLMIKGDLDDLIGITDVLDDRSLNWGVDLFRCDDRNQEVSSPVPALRNGEKLRLCLKPTKRTRDDGVYIGLIKSFQFAREDVTQKAVTTYGTDDVTNVDCHGGSDLCVIESVLSNNFFYSPGEVMAEGVIVLQYGFEEKRKHRSLRTVQVNVRSSPNIRSLYDYEKGELVSEKSVEYPLTIEPMNRVYTAESFPCDRTNRPIKTKSVKEGEHIKLCIQPDEEARDAGVYINSIESFSYGRANDNKIQLAVDSYGRVANDNRTQVECASGLSKCSINSTLEDLFFDEDSKMVVTGSVVLQFGVNNQRRRAQIVYRDLVESSGSGLGFAGRSQVDAFFDTVGRSITVKKGPIEKLFDQWDLSDTQMTILYIVAAVLIVLICLCCCAGCLFIFFVRKRKKEEFKSTTQMPINITIQERDNSNSNSRDDYNSDDPSDQNSEISKDDEDYSPTMLKNIGDGDINEATNDATPRENDVCFDAEEHPGTQAFLEAVKKTLVNLGPVSYSPAVYKNIKRQLSNRQFYVCDQDNEDFDDDINNKQYEWREVTKRELIDIFWKNYEIEKSKLV